MTAFKKILESSMKIRFHDCDPFNHLNNSKYIDYIMTARGDQLLENYGFDIYKLGREKGIGWVSGFTQISYLKPAMLMEEVIIQTRLLYYSGKSLLFEAIMWDREKKIPKAVLWTKLVHFSVVTQKSHTHDAELMALFEKVVNPLHSEMNFETRVKNILL